MVGTISHTTIAGLTGKIQQAVSKSGDPGKWLKSYVRRTLVPPRSNRRWRANRVTKDARRNSENLLARAERGQTWINERPDGGRGRPTGRSPIALASLLGVKARPNDTLVDVLGRFVRQSIKELASIMHGNHKRPFYKVLQILDRLWLPRWVNRRVGAMPPSFRKMIAARDRKLASYY